jgi:hypothetical protein
MFSFVRHTVTTAGKPFPWTESALFAGGEYTDNLDLNPEEKDALKSTFEDLASDTPRTPLAASRFKLFVTKVGPEAGRVLQQIVVSVMTEAAKKAAGL